MSTRSAHELHSSVHQTLRKAVAGPYQLVVDHFGPAQGSLSAGGDTFFSGWRVLHLVTSKHRLTSDEYHETRSIYANWGDSQRPQLPVAVLRATHWSRAYLLSLVKQLWMTPQQSIAIPARFVSIPLEQAQDWVATVTHLSVPVGEPEHRDESEQRRQLLIDLRWIDRVFEKHWDVNSAGHETLNRCWERVWEEMGVILRTATPLREPMQLRESFRATDEADAPYRDRPYHYDRSSFDPQS